MSTIDWTAIRQKYLPDPDDYPLPAQIELPVFPRVVTEFVRRSSDPNSDLREIAHIIETDSNLTCDLLRHVNSAALGRRYKANTVHQALTALGLRRCKLFLMTAAVQSSVKGMTSGLVDLGDFWTANIERGMFAREIALKEGYDPDVAYTGAILQDFILPQLTHHYKEEYSTYLRERTTKSADFTTFEQTRFRCNHGMLGAICLLKWGFPDDLVCCVLLHHQPENVLEKEELLNTPVYAASAAALLPDPLQQEPMGIQKLVARQEHDADFDLFSIAEIIDAEWENVPGMTGNRAPLVDRMETYIESYLQESVNDNFLLHRQVGNYSLEDVIGEGSMGIVYKARHKMLSRPAAVKLIRMDLLSPQTADLFEKEVQATCMLESQHTIAVYDYGHTPDGLFYYAMEHLDGITLKELVTQYGPQPQHRVLEMMKQICSALYDAHSHGIVHRDIKPENVMLTKKGQQFDVVKVLDYGLAKHLEPDAKDKPKGSRGQGLTGTPLYLAPEAIDTPHLVDHMSDIYSFGALAYYLLAGETVFTGNDLVDICLKQVMERPVSLSERCKGDLHPDLEKIIMLCLSKAKEERPQSMQLVRQQLMQITLDVNWGSEEAESWWQNHQPLQDQLQHDQAEKPVDETADDLSATYIA